jgi:hypothetical protein
MNKLKYQWKSLLTLVVYLAWAVSPRSLRKHLILHIGLRNYDRAICKAFPNLYVDRHASILGSCMPWGFEIGPGWRQLVWDLSEKLEAIIRELPAEIRHQVRASQVKSKYAELRFYTTWATATMDRLIGDAEIKSQCTCELCGRAGTIHGKRWVTCLCPKCAAQGADHG